MSAYLVAPEHIGALAAFCIADPRNRHAVYELRGACEFDTLRAVAVTLAKGNMDSMTFKYGDHGTDLTPEQFTAACVAWAEKYYTLPPELGPLDYYRMANCLDYQSCEVDDWESTLAWKQISWIKAGAVSSLPGYADATRDWQDNTPVNEPLEAAVNRGQVVSLFALATKGGRK